MIIKYLMKISNFSLWIQKIHFPEIRNMVKVKPKRKMICFM